jgi:type IV secretory pathway VirB3-like protein
MDGSDTLAGCFLGSVALVVIANLLFWGAVVFIILHFVAKVW